jgi:hypothetical protein
MANAWNVPQLDLPGFLPRLARSLIGLAIIGGAFAVNAALAAVATGGGHGIPVRVPLLAGLMVVNLALYLASFRILTPGGPTLRALAPGAAVAAVGFTVLITVGSGLVQHQVRDSSATYGQFGVVIGLVAFLLLLAKISLYGAELNPVLSRHLWPRGLLATRPTEADDRVLWAVTHQDRRRQDQRIGVGFGPQAQQDVARDARADGPHIEARDGQGLPTATSGRSPGTTEQPRSRAMSDHTEPDDATEQSDRSSAEHTADRPATEQEAAAADRHHAADDPERRADVARHEEEMMEIGANVKGEGAID